MYNHKNRVLISMGDLGVRGVGGEGVTELRLPQTTSINFHCTTCLLKYLQESLACLSSPTNPKTYVGENLVKKHYNIRSGFT